MCSQEKGFLICRIVWFGFKAVTCLSLQLCSAQVQSRVPRLLKSSLNQPILRVPERARDSSITSQSISLNELASIDAIDCCHGKPLVAKVTRFCLDGSLGKGKGSLLSAKRPISSCCFFFARVASLSNCIRAFP